MLAKVNVNMQRPWQPEMTATEKIPVEKSKLILAGEVAQRVEIEDFRLVKTSARQNLLPGPLPTVVNLSFSYRTDLDREGKRITVYPLFIFDATHHDSADALAPLHIEAEFLIRYTIKEMDGLTDENFKAFGELNGRYNGWPYWREYVHQMLSRMGLPSFLVPVWRPSEDDRARKHDEKGNSAIAHGATADNGQKKQPGLISQ